MIYKLTAGRLLCGEVRDYLTEAKFKGADIEWIESKGWIERDFVVKGNDNHVKQIGMALNAWAARLREAEQ